ncbi:hypothetical protein N9L68_08695, partial [bacterium]|nr:hypothetical protein [bacterium]
RLFGKQLGENVGILGLYRHFPPGAIKGRCASMAQLEVAVSQWSVGQRLTGMHGGDAAVVTRRRPPTETREQWWSTEA